MITAARLSPNAFRALPNRLQACGRPLGLVCLLLPGLASGAELFHRSSGDGGAARFWDDGNHPWYNTTIAGTQNRPDIGVPPRHALRIGHNDFANIDVNGATFDVYELVIQAGSTIARTFSSVDSGGLGLETGGLRVDSSGNQTFNIPLRLDSATVDFLGNSGSAQIDLNGAVNLQSFTARFGGSSASTIFTVSGLVSGTGGITKQDGNRLNLTADNNYTGTTLISGGTLALGTGGTAGNVASATITNNGVLEINRSNTITVAGDIGGSGELHKLGSNILILSGNNDYTGQTLHSAGIIRLANNDALGSGTYRADSAVDTFKTLSSSSADPRTVPNDLEIYNAWSVGGTGTGAMTFTGAVDTGSVGSGTRTLNINVPTRLEGDISGVWGINKQTAGTTLTLTGSNSYTGQTILGAGTLQIGDGGAGGTVGTGGNIRMLGGVLAINRSDNHTIANAISDSNASSSIQHNGSGTTTLTGSNTSSAPFIINNGTLSRTAGAHTGGSSYTVNSPGTLNHGGGSVAATQTELAGGSFTQSAGTFTVNDFVVSAGTLTHSAGDLNIDNLFHINGSGNSVGMSALAGRSAAGDSVLRYTVDSGGTSAIDLSGSADPFARYGSSLSNWAADWSVELRLTPGLGSSFVETLPLISGVDLSAMSGEVNLRAYSYTLDFVDYDAVTNGQVIQLNSGDTQAKYTVVFDANGFSLELTGTRAIPEPGTVGLLALAVGLLRLLRHRHRA